MSNFVGDLSFGQKWEATARLIMSRTEDVQEVAPQGMFKGWDFRTNVGKYEVKADRLAYKYGGKTMFIEFACSGQQSGINTTEADFYFYIMVKPNGEFDCFRLPIADLKVACRGCVVKKGGDGWRASGYIVPVLEQFRVPKSVPHTDTPTQHSLRIVLPPQSSCPSGNTSPTPSS